VTPFPAPENNAARIVNMEGEAAAADKALLVSAI
jgi:hypothetical protein